VNVSLTPCVKNKSDSKVTIKSVNVNSGDKVHKDGKKQPEPKIPKLAKVR
jgi:NADPH-dependent glutamate synthase beta subunit-like oxidoreductase